MVRLLGVLVTLLLVPSACGGGAAPAPTTAAPAAATAAPAAAGSASEVTMQGFQFRPQSLEVTVGTRVTWTNNDGAAHTTTSGTPGSKDGKWDGPLSGSGGAFAFTFAQAGTFAYFCSIHPSITGTVVAK